MVGDWVADRENGFPMQVTSPSGDYMYADFDGNEGDVWEYDDKISPAYPIPLTAEMLEKNGFVKNDDRNELSYSVNKDGSIHFCIRIWGNKDEFGHCNVRIVDVDGGDIYVHTVQQALRLAGLCKEANNFKI